MGTRVVADWHDVAEMGKAAIFANIVMTIFDSVLVAGRGMLSVVVDPTQEGVADAAAWLFLILPFSLLFLQRYFLLTTVYIQTRLLRCAAAQPVAADETDVRDVVWWLQHFQWLHRLACRLWGRDYDALLEICRKASRPDIEALSRERPPSKTTMAFLKDYHATHMLAMTWRDLFRRTKSGRHEPREDSVKAKRGSP